MAATLMRRWFPTTSHPLVISAPMDFVTNARLATEVTKAGGLGFIQGGRDFKPGSALVTKTLDEQLTTARKLLAGHLGSANGCNSSATLPLGVGFVAYDASAVEHFNSTTLPILARHRPCVVWLFAPSPERPGTIRKIVEALRQAAAVATAAALSSGSSGGDGGDREVLGPWDLHIAVQVGTVEAARQAVADGADIIVAQGVDAGGHQFASGAGIVSLVPEIADMLSSMTEDGRSDGGTREIALWAAGGIVDGRGVAAALALGADAAVLGTRYMVATESDAQDFKRQAILSTSDGGQNTVKAYIHDHVQGNHSWPEFYDGRAIVHPSYTDHVGGLSLDENKAMFKKAKDRGEVSRMVTWSGTGVGLVREELPAAEITRKVREEAAKVMKGLR
ncbi:2-nitropropane dioxygenase [Microdochium trichocladiopsis]|uniref:2-nitropropane dioxygenase n=1 Tax=Microdochium trichocladiopsis TaxID=1682393 RepID=A0A9P9BX46_9PEZI|nr:2-nitropropane dioxygenase [Microdochium trichocladiopsis]KAH7041457.1 2-nitropropane dioxygenase [Microdochium trichocladiopsis]